MTYSWPKRMFAYATFAAVGHSTAWAGFVHHIRTVDYQKLEQRQAVIKWLDWTKVGPGMQPSRFYSLYLKMQPLTLAGAATQLVVFTNPRSTVHAYFEGHRAGDVVDAWVDRRSGGIQEIFPPEAPDFFKLLRLLLPSLGAATFLLAVIIYLGVRNAQLERETEMEGS